MVRFNLIGSWSKTSTAPTNTAPTKAVPIAAASPAALVRRQRPFRLAGRRLRRRQRHELAAAVLERGATHLVVLALLVERDAGTDADIVGDVRGADGIRQRLRVGRAG